MRSQLIAAGVAASLAALAVGCRPVRHGRDTARRQRDHRRRHHHHAQAHQHAGNDEIDDEDAATPEELALRIAELQGTATTSATFKQAGEYVIRVRTDNFGRLDSVPGDQCCWTNGYVKVTVTLWLVHVLAT